MPMRAFRSAADIDAIRNLIGRKIITERQSVEGRAS
jgi:hypothetical protein